VTSVNFENANQHATSGPNHFERKKIHIDELLNLFYEEMLPKGQPIGQDAATTIELVVKGRNIKNFKARDAFRQRLGGAPNCQPGEHCELTKVISGVLRPLIRAYPPDDELAALRHYPNVSETLQPQPVRHLLETDPGGKSQKHLSDISLGQLLEKFARDRENVTSPLLLSSQTPRQIAVVSVSSATAPSATAG
jgi:hypothetical protein